MGEQILVIGATLMDVKGKPLAGLEPNTSNPAGIRTTRGGTARNVAENLARYDAQVTLLSAVGNDVIGELLLSQTAQAGVNIEHVLHINGENTGTYMAVLETNGALSVALDDVSVMHHITSDYLNAHADLFASANMVLVDGGLTKEALQTAVSLAKQYNTPLVADPSSSRLAHRLRPYLPQLHLIVPNEVEGAQLLDKEFAGFDPEASMDIARQIVRQGVDIAVVTLSDYGLVFATPEETGYLPGNANDMVDSTGTGDAITAAVIFGLLNNLPVVEAMRLGAAAARLTLQTPDTVVPDLSLDLLYDHLIV